MIHGHVTCTFLVSLTQRHAKYIMISSPCSFAIHVSNIPSVAENKTRQITYSPHL